MDDTHFVLPESKRSRLAALYEPGPGRAIARTGDGPTVKGPLIYSASLPYQGTRAISPAARAWFRRPTTTRGSCRCS